MPRFVPSLQATVTDEAVVKADEKTFELHAEYEEVQEQPVGELQLIEDKL